MKKLMILMLAVMAMVSISAGIASYSGEVAGAVGAMYSWQYEETSFIQNLGINVKAYNGEAGYNGGSAGVTLGF